jgi:hypothetical protein
MASLTPDRTAPRALTARDLRPDTRSREDTTIMFHADIRLAEIRGLHEQHRAIRHGERQLSGRDRSRPDRSIRLRLGESLMRLGRRVGGEALAHGHSDALTTSAWQG